MESANKDKDNVLQPLVVLEDLSMTPSTSRKNNAPPKGEDLLPAGSIRSGPVRTSARVIQKMRQDTRPATPPVENSLDSSSVITPLSSSSSSTATAAASNWVAGSTSSTSSSSSSSSSTTASTIASEQTQGTSPSTALLPTPSCTSTAPVNNTTTTATATTMTLKPERLASAPRTPTTSKQTKMQWSNSERTLFFEALNEFGKDFDAITQFINQKMRRKFVDAEKMNKTRDHVRQLYGKTLSQAMRYLRFSDDVKKVPQELYALINFGEMRRKMPFMNDRALLKLKELVYRGSVTIREKGKTIRIKTPSCRALKKLNQVEELQGDITLPQRIEVTLVPADVNSWCRVQGVAQNPRIKTTIPLYKRLSCFIKFLQLKWRSQDIRLGEKTMSFPPVPTTGSRQLNNNKCTTAGQKNAAAVLPRSSSAENHELMYELAAVEPFLCISPPEKTVIHRPMVNLTDFSNCFSICLNSYEERIGAKVRGEDLPLQDKVQAAKEKANTGKRLRLDSGGEGGTGGSGNGSKKSGTASGPVAGKMKSGSSGVKATGESNSDGEVSKGGSSRQSASASEQPLNASLDVVQSEEELAMDIPMMDFSVIAGESNGREYRGIDLFSDNSEDKRICVKSDPETDQEKPQPTTTVATGTGAVASGGGNAAKSIKRTTKTDVQIGGKGTADKGRGNPTASTSSSSSASYKPLISEEVIKKIRCGWTLNTCGDLTFGDLYVMFGMDCKISLEYRWTPSGTVPVTELLKPEHEVNKKKEFVVEAEGGGAALEVKKEVESVLGRRLGQLLMVAELMDQELGQRNRRMTAMARAEERMKENDRPKPEMGLFKYPAMPTRYSQHTDYNSMLQMRRQKASQMYGFPGPKPTPFQMTPKYYNSAYYKRPPFPIRRGFHPPSTSVQCSTDEEGQEGDAEDEGIASGSNTTSAPETRDSLMLVESVPPPQSALCDGGDEEDADGEDNDDDEVDYSRTNPGLMSLMEISLPSLRGGEEVLRALEMSGSNHRQEWLEDNINDYSFSSLLGHIDVHLGMARQQDAAAAAATGGVDNVPGTSRDGGGGEPGCSSSGTRQTEGSSGNINNVLLGEIPGSGGGNNGNSTVVNGTRIVGGLSDRCSIISESSVDFVKKFAELAGMIQEN